MALVGGLPGNRPHVLERHRVLTAILEQSGSFLGNGLRTLARILETSHRQLVLIISRVTIQEGNV